MKKNSKNFLVFQYCTIETKEGTEVIFYKQYLKKKEKTKYIITKID